MISTYGKGRMGEPKPVQLSLISTMLDISGNHMGLRFAILPCTYVEISANHTGLGSAILSYSYVEIKDNHTCLVLAIPSYSYVEIRDNHTGMNREEWLSTNAYDEH
jgi:crotonobetainyl-CoA:carnitine CoA-transferase CaiB-like acyl-CoA transferase